MKSSFFRDVYDVVKKIPSGKVATYGRVASIIQSSCLAGRQANFKVQNDNLKLKMTPRLAGIALHRNPDPENIPCHRVVDRDGKLADNFAFGGWKEQKKRLLAEGVLFKDKLHVDLASCVWDKSNLACQKDKENARME